MSLPHATITRIGVIELPALAEHLRSAGHEVVTGPDLRSAIAAISAASAEHGPLPIVVSDTPRAGFRVWIEKVVQMTDVFMVGTGEPFEGVHMIDPDTSHDEIAAIFTGEEITSERVAVVAEETKTVSHLPEGRRVQAPTVAAPVTPQADDFDPWANRARVSPEPLGGAELETHRAAEQPAIEIVVEEPVVEDEIVVDEPEVVAEEPEVTELAAAAPTVEQLAGETEPVDADLEVDLTEIMAERPRRWSGEIEEQIVPFAIAAELDIPGETVEEQIAEIVTAEPSQVEDEPVIEEVAEIVEPEPVVAEEIPVEVAAPLPAPVLVDPPATFVDETPVVHSDADQQAPSTGSVTAAPVIENPVHAEAMPTEQVAPMAPRPTVTPVIPAPPRVARVAPIHTDLAPVIFCISGRGGVGKSTFSMSLAQRAAEIGGIRTVLVDANHAQGDMRVYLRLNRAGLPSVYDAGLAGDPSLAIVSPEQLAAARGDSLEELKFALAMAPPSGQVDPSVVRPDLYAGVIAMARKAADLVIVDTQIIGSVDEVGMVDDLITPALRGGAWGLAISDLSAAGVDNLLDRLKTLNASGVSRDHLMVALNKVPASGKYNRERTEAAFNAHANFLGAITSDEGAIEAMNAGSTLATHDGIAPVLDEALARVTGEGVFREQTYGTATAEPAKKKKRWGRRG